MLFRFPPRTLMQVRGTGVAKRDRLVPHRGQFFGRLGAAPSGNLMSESPNAAACGQELADCLIEIRLPSFSRLPGTLVAIHCQA